MKPGEYETIRLKNLEDNKRVLAAFGLMNPFKPAQCVVKKSNRPVLKLSATKKRPLPKEDLLPTGSLYGTRRKSARLDGKQAAGEGLDFGSTYEELDEAEKQMPRTPVDRPNFYGPVPGVEVGTEWATRMECSKDGIHRPTVAGIHGGQDGAYSIALSGGYEDDLDLGDCFTYTGEGGRDLKGTKAKPKNLRTAPQSKDQTLTRGNLALSRSVETKNPVRVIRGYKLTSQFAPEEGYRYDGIYTVEKFWFTTGLSGYGVWKFALKRCPDQAASPWQFIEVCDSSAKPKELMSDPEIVSQEASDSALLAPDCDKSQSPPTPSSSHDEQDSPVSEVLSTAVPSLPDKDDEEQKENRRTPSAEVELLDTKGEDSPSPSTDKQWDCSGFESSVKLEDNNNESKPTETEKIGSSSPTSEKESEKPEETKSSLVTSSGTSPASPSAKSEDSNASNGKGEKAED